mmetsp:Transcript_17569/g.52779  ORF Transcript_17569/g.52779 Transcript_17569/m.52779 type:complete len:92 (+) Transcript_17569:212-487(+)
MSLSGRLSGSQAGTGFVPWWQRGRQAGLALAGRQAGGLLSLSQQAGKLVIVQQAEGLLVLVVCATRHARGGSSVEGRNSRPGREEGRQAGW